ncbi:MULTISPECIES: hypothetical protein [Streptomyces]|uniref:Uncharacterized protein n=2 Tax=Streptomyces TaxID=1883 RepID=A0ABV9J8V0_9ACTN
MSWDYVDEKVVDDFVTRYGLVPRDETARAADSQARWSLEADGRTTIQLLSDDSAARIIFPTDPRIHQWTAMARVGGGSVSLIVALGLPDTELVTIGRHLGPYGGPYWYISVGCTPLWRPITPPGGHGPRYPPLPGRAGRCRGSGGPGVGEGQCSCLTTGPPEHRSYWVASPWRTPGSGSRPRPLRAE